LFYWGSQLTIKALWTNSSSFGGRYEITGLRSWSNQMTDSITQMQTKRMSRCRTIINNTRARLSKVQNCTSHKLPGENSLAISEEKAEEQDNCQRLGANLEKTDLENPSRSVMPSASSSEYEPTILKASHACQFAISIVT
jgi:hypothetical protein